MKGDFHSQHAPTRHAELLKFFIPKMCSGNPFTIDDTKEWIIR